MSRFIQSSLLALFGLTSALCLTQCDSGEKSATTSPPSTKATKSQSPPAVAVPVEVRADGLAYQPGQSSPFTGEAIVINPDITPAVVLQRIPYVDGKKHGAATRWSPKGRILEERRYEHGVPKSCINYHSNGEKKIQTILNAQDKAEGPYFRWHDNGVLQVESAFDTEERFHGEEKLYDRDGKLIGHYRNEHGKMVQIIFETPEEKVRRLAHWAELEKAAQESASDGQ